MLRESWYDMRLLLCTFVFGCFINVASVYGQEVVHALAGKVVSVDMKANSFVLSPDDGTDGSFKLSSAVHHQVDFSKDVRSETTPAASSKTGSEVVLFYDGYGSERVALAVQALGSGPFDKNSGTVANFNRHEHLLTIKTDAGANESFHINEKTVAETSDGVESGDKFNPEKGSQIRVVASKSGNVVTALFVRSS